MNVALTPAAQGASGIAFLVLEMSRLPGGSCFVGLYRLVAFDASSLLLAGQQGLLDRHDSPAD